VDKMADLNVSFISFSYIYWRSSLYQKLIKNRMHSVVCA